MTNTSSTSLPTSSNTDWWNWSENLSHTAPTDGSDNYFAPKTQAELQSVLADAATKGVTVRVSGQRHSQPPLVAGNNGSGSATVTDYLIDMSCYMDLANGTTNMVLDATANTLQVNTGVREDVIDEYLTKNNKMMKTVTAGGFFSIGGMTSVDVHGATIAQPIFSGTVSAYTIMQHDGTVVTIDTNTPAVTLQSESWDPINFARVNLGGLGVVTSITLDVQDRPYATTLEGGTTSFQATSKSDFQNAFVPLLNSHDRVESFFNPYADGFITKEFLAVWWNEISDPANKVPNSASSAEGACELASKGEWGADEIKDAWIAGKVAQGAKISAGLVTAAGMGVIAAQAAAANKKYSDLWLTTATRVMFMSYFIEIGSLDDAGLGIVYDALQDVVGQMEPKNKHDFWIAAPMEFRFITGSEVAMAGTYTTKPNSIFVNLDLIAYIDPVSSDQYPQSVLDFFAAVEKSWFEDRGGFPHNGKMYGFYDPSTKTTSTTGAFNSNFVAAVGAARGTRLKAFNDYRAQMDPNGRFLNPYLKEMLGA